MNDAATPARKRILPRKTDVAPTLGNLQQIIAYQEANAHIFASVPSLNWFIRQHRAELLEAGAIVQLTGRWLVDGPLFTQKVGFTRFSGHFHLASKPPLKLGWADITQR